MTFMHKLKVYVLTLFPPFIVEELCEEPERLREAVAKAIQNAALKEATASWSSGKVFEKTQEDVKRKPLHELLIHVAQVVQEQENAPEEDAELYIALQQYLIRWQCFDSAVKRGM